MLKITFFILGTLILLECANAVVTFVTYQTEKRTARRSYDSYDRKYALAAFGWRATVIFAAMLVLWFALLGIDFVLLALGMGF